MKKLIIVLLCFIPLLSCDDLSWKMEIDQLKEELAAQKNLIEQLQKGAQISRIQETTSGYTLVLTNGESIAIKHGTTPLITIGENGHWYIDGMDTGKQSSGEKGDTPSIKIGSDGFWYINDQNTNVRAEGKDGNNAPLIASIVETDTNFIVNYTDGSSTISLKSNVIVCWGDSLTAMGYPQVLQTKCGSDYIVLNAGVGGENAYTIAARQGGNGMTFKNDFDLGPEYTNVDLVDYHGRSIQILLQGGWETVNPCYIDGIECNITWTGDIYGNNGNWQIKRSSGENHTQITSGTPIITNYMRTKRIPYAMIIWIGQNRGFSDSEDLISQIQSMIDYSNCERVLVIGFHTEGLLKENESLQKKFGARFLDWNAYAVKSSMQDLGLIPTEQDELDIAKGICPASLRSDNVHLNQIGKEYLSSLICRRMKDLGYIQ